MDGFGGGAFVICRRAGGSCAGRVGVGKRASGRGDGSRGGDREGADEWRRVRRLVASAGCDGAAYAHEYAHAHAHAALAYFYSAYAHAHAHSHVRACADSRDAAAGEYTRSDADADAGPGPYADPLGVHGGVQEFGQFVRRVRRR